MNHRIENIQNCATNNIADFRVAPHESIDSHNVLPERNSIDMFCDVSQEEWKEKSSKKKKGGDKNRMSKMKEWLEEKWDYIKIHWRATLVIGSIFVILLALFITAVLLLTLLPRKNDSVESNNVTPGPTTTGPTKAPESGHGKGWLKSMQMNSYQFKDNISIIDSIVLDSNNNLLLFADSQIILVDIEKQTIRQNPFSINCKKCKIYYVLPGCFSPKPCGSESVFYCCQQCDKAAQTPRCSNFGVFNFYDGSIIQNGVFYHENDSNKFQAEVIQSNNNSNCQIRMDTYVSNSQGSAQNSGNGESQHCSIDPKNYNTENLLAASARKEQTSFTWRANIDVEGSLELYNGDESKFYIYNFVNTTLADKTLLKMKYNGVNSFYVIAFCEQTFSIAQINENGTISKLKVLQPLPLKLDIALGLLIDWDFYGDDLYVWHFGFNRIYSTKMSFEWD